MTYNVFGGTLNLAQPFIFVYIIHILLRILVQVVCPTYNRCILYMSALMMNSMLNTLTDNKM